MALLHITDLDPQVHHGVEAKVLGEWEVPGTLNWNEHSQRWELTVPRPHLRPGHQGHLWLLSDDTVETL